MSIRKYPKNRLGGGAEKLLPQLQAPSPKCPLPQRIAGSGIEYYGAVREICINIADHSLQKRIPTSRTRIVRQHCRQKSKNRSLRTAGKKPSGREGKNTDQPNTHCLPALPAKSKNRRLPPAVHARRKEERKNEKLNLSNYIVPRKF